MVDECDMMKSFENYTFIWLLLLETNKASKMLGSLTIRIIISDPNIAHLLLFLYFVNLTIISFTIYNS